MSFGSNHEGILPPKAILILARIRPRRLWIATLFAVSPGSAEILPAKKMAVHNFVGKPITATQGFMVPLKTTQQTMLLEHSCPLQRLDFA